MAGGRILTGAIAAAALLAGCGGGSKAPPSAEAQARAAVQRYVDALGRKDAKAACAAMSVQSQQATGGTGRLCVTNIVEAIATSQGSYKGAKATKVTLAGDHATVQVDLANGGITHLTAVREHGQWKYEATPV